MLKNASILRLFYEILLGSEQLQMKSKTRRYFCQIRTICRGKNHTELNETGSDFSARLL